MLYSPQKDAPIKTGTREGSGLDSGKGNEVRKGRDSSLASRFLLPLPSQLKRSVERDIYWGGGGGGGGGEEVVVRWLQVL